MSDGPPISSYCRGKAHERCVGDARDHEGALAMCTCLCHRLVTSASKPTEGKSF